MSISTEPSWAGKLIDDSSDECAGTVSGLAAETPYATFSEGTYGIVVIRLSNPCC